MPADIRDLQAFYSSALGHVAGQQIRHRLRALWPDLRGQAVLGLGYTTPYLRLWREEAARTLALMPAGQGATRWPRGGPSLTCIAEEDALPLPDLSVDRVLMVHALEHAEHVRRAMREVWRVLKDEGRLIVVAPNRRGMWAHFEATPFGSGQPYSAGQLERLLADSMFQPVRRETAIYIPPWRLKLMMGMAQACERAGSMVFSRFAGIVLVEARKQVYGAVPGGALARAPAGRRVIVTVPDAG
ncbi:MAG: class I SAM-dependent methyltransferase [Alphaproteobacteria bacterium]|nr:class I SAM-dependent methyltransferase [Alphaproteobacteria bacterium]